MLAPEGVMNASRLSGRRSDKSRRLISPHCNPSVRENYGFLCISERAAVRLAYPPAVASAEALAAASALNVGLLAVIRHCWLGKKDSPAIDLRYARNSFRRSWR